ALSSFAKLPLPNLRPFSIAQCAREALENNPVADRIQVTFVCADSLPLVLADRDQIRIVFGNLIRNSRDAMAEGGQLSIRGRHVQDSVEVDITDTGVGISAENLSRIMEPLYSTKARGLGLGLALARTILEKNKGDLRVVSQPGQGSTFTVRLLAHV